MSCKHDMQLYLKLLPMSKESGERLDQGLEVVRGGRRANKLRLNHDKMEVVVVGPDSDLGNGNKAVLDGVALPLKAYALGWGFSWTLYCSSMPRWWQEPGMSFSSFFCVTNYDPA